MSPELRYDARGHGGGLRVGPQPHQDSQVYLPDPEGSEGSEGSEGTEGSGQDPLSGSTPHVEVRNVTKFAQFSQCFAFWYICIFKRSYFSLFHSKKTFYKNKFGVKKF